MNYDQALKIAADHAPKLLFDPEVKGQGHIVVRTTKEGPPFSIMLPRDPVPTGDVEADAAAQEATKKAFTDALDAAVNHLPETK